MESRTCRVTLAFSPFLTCQRVTMDIHDHQMSIDRQLGLKGGRLAITEDVRLDVR